MNFVKNTIVKMWFWTCEFLDKSVILPQFEFWSLAGFEANPEYKGNPEFEANPYFWSESGFG